MTTEKQTRADQLLDSGAAKTYMEALLMAEIEELIAALNKIATSPHCQYVDGKFISDHDSGYKMGIADGHRFCAAIAKQALATVNWKTV